MPTSSAPPPLAPHMSALLSALPPATGLAPPSFAEVDHLCQRLSAVPEHKLRGGARGAQPISTAGGQALGAPLESAPSAAGGKRQRGGAKRGKDVYSKRHQGTTAAQQ